MKAEGTSAPTWTPEISYRLICLAVCRTPPHISVSPDPKLCKQLCLWEVDEKLPVALVQLGAEVVAR